MNTPKSGKMPIGGILLAILGIIILTAVFVFHPDLLAVTEKKDPSWTAGILFWIGFITFILGIKKILPQKKFSDRNLNELQK